MEELDLRATKRASGRALYGRSKLVLAGFLGNAVVGLIALLWEPLDIGQSLLWVPRWVWGVVAGAGFVSLTFVAFHRMRVDFIKRIKADEKKIPALEDQAAGRTVDRRRLISRRADRAFFAAVAVRSAAEAGAKGEFLLRATVDKLLDDLGRAVADLSAALEDADPVTYARYRRAVVELTNASRIFRFGSGDHGYVEQFGKAVDALMRLSVEDSLDYDEG
jgi:hypothetical protein